MTAFIDDRDDLLAAVDLESLFAELVGPRGRSGGWPCPNPQHAQSGATPPVSLSEARKLWHCHGCDVGGSAVDLLRVARGLDLPAAFAELRHRSGQEHPRPRPRPHPSPPANPSPLPPAAGERALSRFLGGRGWRQDVAELAGLHAVLDTRGRPRVRFPYRCSGESVWHQDRAAYGAEPKWLSPPGQRPVPYAVGDLGDALDAAQTCGASSSWKAHATPSPYGTPGPATPSWPCRAPALRHSTGSPGR